MAPHPEMDHFAGRVYVSLFPVNKYGDRLEPETEISYTVAVKGSLAEIVARLELLKEARRQMPGPQEMTIFGYKESSPAGERLLKAYVEGDWDAAYAELKKIRNERLEEERGC